MDTTKHDQVKLIQELSGYDHAFISQEGVDYFTKPFGFRGSTYLAKANPHDHKGLSLHDANGNPISELRGQDASVVAQEICQHLGVSYLPQYGRGSQLRECCSALLAYLNA